MKKTNWEKIKTEYITTKISTRKLAEKYKVALATVQNKCKKEKWVEERNKHNRKVISKAVQKTENSKAFSLAQEMAAANKLSNAIMECLNDSQQFLRYVVTEGYGPGCSEASEKIFDKYDTKAMKDLALTLNSVSNLKKDINNVLSEKDRIMIELAKQKLEIDKLRLEIDKQKAEHTESRDITVTISDDIKEWSQ